MEWSDSAIVLGSRKHGEGHAILDVLTGEHGRASGYVRGGSSRRQRPDLQAGNRVEVTWRGRLDEHLGTFRVEIVSALAPGLFHAPARLAALNALAALLMAVLPEREPAVEIYRAASAFLDRLCDAAIPDSEWAAGLVRFECLVLKTLGFGLDLEKCAGTGDTDNLTFVSPNTGRAVGTAAGQPYRDKLLILPAFLTGAGAATRADIAAGFRLTGHFISGHLLHGPNPAYEAARSRFLNYFS